MSEADIARVKEQERRLVFPLFGEETAFRLGSAIRARALEHGWPIVADIRTFDRPLFYAALPGSTADNANWARRKFNTVRHFLCSTYRLVLEQKSPDRAFKTGFGLPISDYVLAGGGFPVTVEGAGVIGAIMVSGLPERQDHAVILRALCEELGVEPRRLMLAEGSAG